MNQNTLLIILLFFCFQFCSAQTIRTIEVNASHYLMVPGDTFTYSITLQNDHELGQYEVDIKEEKKLTKDKLENLVALHNGKIMEHPMRTQIMQRAFSDVEMILVQFTDADHFDEFQNNLKEYANIYGNMLEMSLKDSEKYENDLISKVLEKAEKKAKKIAQSIQAELIQIVSIKDGGNANHTSGGWTAYPPLSALPQGGDSFFGTDMRLEHTMTVVFEIK